MLSDEKVFYVYEWFIRDTNEVFYVGKGKGKRYKTISRRNKYFNDIYNSHECDVRILIDGLTEKEAFDYEHDVILFLKENTDYKLTNQSDGGEGCTGYHPTEEVIEKMSRANKEKWNDNSFRQKMLDIRNDPNGSYKSKSFREKISKIVSGENNPNYKHYWTDKQKKHLSDVKKGKKLRSDNPHSKKIICLETGKIYDCIEDAVDELSINHGSSISIALKHDTRTAAGYHWKFFSDELLDDNNRKKVLIDILSRSRNQSYICLETGTIYSSRKELEEAIDLSYVNFKKYETGNCLNYKDHTYMPIKEYINCPVY